MSNVVKVGEVVTRFAAASTVNNLRVKSGGGNWNICGASDRSDGVSVETQFTTGLSLAAQLIGPGMVCRFVANATIAVDDPIWGDANGKVTNVYAVGAEFLGFAQTAGVAGGIVEVLIRSLRMIEGQATTVTASDTIVTGLAKVLAAFAVLDDSPVLTCSQAQASIGNQSGAPAAGSILLETWMPTDATHTTLIAATTFGKKVNWVAWGY